ncbi:aspartate carbamoyltransferase [Spirochaeta cellobiosiphila]|uniref:aspartate carbamoyltransferase n=1 Tax=Spirochaeta cellobiosiphila TaxID=504483 RepID=UPI00040C995E|nr:aspartate carbamoyltransferase [Spirochaeta cellobiosiphila]
MNHPFKGRTISVVEDLSLDEQWYMYQQTAKLKRSLKEGKDVSSFRINDPEFSVYLMFFEDSTRTKESFRNAALFHRCRLNVFDANSSSFNKKESLTDTIKMLTGYSEKSLFIIRSPQEGVCRMLETNIGDYAEKMDFIQPSFINAGDGKHEHPTQEFLDEFSFLEQNEWNRDSIHIALVGDLFHGRTVHSKANGLKIFNNVSVDLIAPAELSMPSNYIQIMKSNGFKIREFQSIESYLAQQDVAKIWYFTRLQLERMGDKVLDKADSLRSSVTFKRQYLKDIPEGTKFYHPLPRHRVYPVIPPWLDSTDLNGYDEQSVNGYLTRIIEIGLLGGALGEDFTGATKEVIYKDEEFVIGAPIKKKPVRDVKTGIKPVENGIVIDHIGFGAPIPKIWNQIDKIRKTMELNYSSSHGVFSSRNIDQYKGIISLPNILSFDRRQMKMLGAIAPGCTVNIVKNQEVKEKYRLLMPPRIYNFDQISCRNTNCISHKSHNEPIITMFYRSSEDRYVCKFCEKSYSFDEIWN